MQAQVCHHGSWLACKKHALTKTATEENWTRNRVENNARGKKSPIPLLNDLFVYLNTKKAQAHINHSHLTISRNDFN